MIIRKDLLREEMREDGYCPVVIRIQHNGKTRFVQTPVFTKEAFWNVAACRIERGESDGNVKNEIIDSIYRRVSGKIQSFIDSMLDDKLDSLINYSDNNNDTEGRTTNCNRHSAKLEETIKETISDEEPAGVSFLQLVDMKTEASVSHNTRRGYESFRRYVMRRFGDGPGISEINQGFTNDFIAGIDSDYCGSESMRRFMISRFNAVVNFGKESGIIPRVTKISLPPYYLLPANRNLTGEEICNIFSAFNEAVASDPEITRRDTMALGLFILDIAFQGLAPVDLANLKVKSIKFTTLHAFDKNPHKYSEDAEYRSRYESSENRMQVITLSTTRKKTGRPVEIVASTLGIEKIVNAMRRGKAPDDYLLQCFDREQSYTPSQRQNRLANYFNMMARNLNRALTDYYKRHNLGENRRVTFYFARHAFCNLVDSMDIPRHIIQHMVGHRRSVLETSYLRPITPWEQAQISHTLLSRYFK